MPRREERRMEQVDVNLTDLLYRLRIARRRMGESPQERLRCLLGFLGRDLSALREGEWLELDDDLKAFATGLLSGELHGPEERWWVDWNPFAPLGRRRIQRIQNGLTTGLKMLLETGKWNPPKVAAPVSLQRIRERKTGRTRIVKHYKTNLLDSIVVQAIDLKEWGGDQIRACQECHRPFLAVKRQIYCSRRCSQRTRDRRFRAGHTREELSKKRHQLYERKVRRLRGLAETTRIGRRRKG